MRVVLDTNVLISALISRDGMPGQVLNAWIDGRFILILSSFILEEFFRISVYKIKFNEGKILRLINFLKQSSELVEPVQLEAGQADANDWTILGTAIAGSADYLVTGDVKLLNIKYFHRIQIIGPAEFLRILIR